MMMNGHSPRNGSRFNKSPPFLVPGLLVVIVILSFNYWRTSRLNKELLERVAVADGNSQKLSYEMKDAADRNKERIESLERTVGDQKGQIDTAKEALTREKEKSEYCSKYASELSETIQKLNNDLDSLKEEGQTMKDNNAQLKDELSELGELNGKIDGLQDKIEELNITAVTLDAEKLVLMNFLASELGKEGIESVLKEKVHLPDSNDFRMPAPDQKPMCLKRAEDVFLANPVKGAQQQNLERNDNHIQSPNAEAMDAGELHTQQEGDMPEDRPENHNQGPPGININQQPGLIEQPSQYQQPNQNQQPAFNQQMNEQPAVNAIPQPNQLQNLEYVGTNDNPDLQVPVNANLPINTKEDGHEAGQSLGEARRDKLNPPIGLHEEPLQVNELPTALNKGDHPLLPSISDVNSTRKSIINETLATTSERPNVTVKEAPSPGQVDTGSNDVVYAAAENTEAQSSNASKPSPLPDISGTLVTKEGNEKNNTQISEKLATNGTDANKNAGLSSSKSVYEADMTGDDRIQQSSNPNSTKQPGPAGIDTPNAPDQEDKPADQSVPAVSLVEQNEQGVNQDIPPKLGEAVVASAGAITEQHEKVIGEDLITVHTNPAANNTPASGYDLTTTIHTTNQINDHMNQTAETNNVQAQPVVSDEQEKSETNLETAKSTLAAENPLETGDNLPIRVDNEATGTQQKDDEDPNLNAGDDDEDTEKTMVTDSDGTPATYLYEDDDEKNKIKINNPYDEVESTLADDDQAKTTPAA